MKFKKLLWASLGMLLTIGVLNSCTHDDDLITPGGTADLKRGTDVIDMAGGWTFDKSHSSVIWETAYMGTAALLSGRFNMFGMTSMKFDEANPANTSFEGWVRLNTVNTGEPGRDGGCLLGTFGTNATNVDQPENIAKLKSTSVTLSTTDKGYIVLADLTFHGVTKQVTVKLDYNGTAEFTGTTPYKLGGLTAQFQFNAKSDFGIASNNIADKVSVKINCNFKKS
ncbi:MAG TPA: YceI family protein [Chitinophagaceae bacterium]